MPQTFQGQRQPFQVSQIKWASSAAIVTSIAELPSSGDLNAGKTVTLTLNLNEAVTVAGGTPTLTLNDGGTATFSGGSGSKALTFNYKVAAGQHTVGLGRHFYQSQFCNSERRRRQCRQLLAHRPDPEWPADRHHHADRVIGGVIGERHHERSGDLNAGKTVTLTLKLSEAVTVAGGKPDAHAQRRRHRHLYRWLRQQCTDLQLHRRRRAKHRRPHSEGAQAQLGDRHRCAPATPPISPAR